MKYAIKKSGGQVEGLGIFLRTDAVPVGYEEITYDEFVNIESNVNTLATAQQIACEHIDVSAGECRLKYITSTPGQAETYMMKATEAKEIKALGYANVTDLTAFPVMAGELIATGFTLDKACENVLFIESMWRQKAAQIESVRRRGKLAVMGTSTIPAMLVAEQAIVAELSSL